MTTEARMTDEEFEAVVKTAEDNADDYEGASTEHVAPLITECRRARAAEVSADTALARCNEIVGAQDAQLAEARLQRDTSDKQASGLFQRCVTVAAERDTAIRERDEARACVHHYVQRTLLSVTKMVRARRWASAWKRAAHFEARHARLGRKLLAGYSDETERLREALAAERAKVEAEVVAYLKRRVAEEDAATVAGTSTPRHWNSYTDGCGAVESAIEELERGEHRPDDVRKEGGK
jgi:hypothetical protein